ncbi:DUF4258 domain-containing protein [Candidatus Marithrix sp. Canyon 246]|uniref:DUF4258 domain-containing protein n=1 Tax=Candidatus Marithrix sp. Canyon 246 TaxID=1827136 RepID=UPI00084A0E0D|nr:DUF4258 domain-containing protein [Candidatus Marithrix sp. Canyon 246]
MRTIRWNLEKNKILKQQRGIYFDDVLIAIEDHPNKEQYPHQRIFIVNIQGYIHIVPFVEDKQGIFLKTVFPSRTYHKKYKHLIS